MTINLPDGSKVSEIVLPDGSTASEVIAPDGSVVFSGAPAIPDSAVNRWTWGEGSGTTTADLIGTSDMTLNGPTFSSGTWVDSFAGSGDGTDDYGDVGTLGTFGSQIDTNFAIGLTVQFSSVSGRICPFGLTSTMNLQLTNDADGSGVLQIVIVDVDGNSIGVKTTNDLSDGSKHRILINKTGNTEQDVKIYVDNTDVSSVFASGTISNVQDFSGAVYTFARHGLGGATDEPQRFYNGELDDFILFNSDLTSTEIQDDYDRQPWSAGSVSQLSLTGSVTDTQLSSPHDTFHSGNYVFSAGKGGSVASTDVSDTTTPTVADAITTYTQVQFVHVDANDSTYLYAGEDGELVTIDITDPTVMSQTNALSVTDFVQPNGAVQVGSSLYVAAKTGSYNEFDITTPSSPSLVQQRVISATDNLPHDVAYGNSTLFGVNQAQGTTDPQVFSLDPANGFATLDSVNDLTNLEGANRVQFYNNYLYVACNYADTVAVFDAADVTNLTNVGVYSTRSPGPSGLELDEANNQLLVGTTEHLQVYDISDPTSLTETAYYDFGSSESIHDPTLPFDTGTRVAWPGQATDTLHISDL